MKIHCIIVIYNGMRHNWIKKCFDSVLSSSIPVNIIAIDNNSTDDSVKYIKENYPTVHLIENKVNKGFGGANNQGLKYALENGGEYFFLLNQDAWVDPNTIEELVKISSLYPGYGVISPIHLNGKGDALDYNFSNYIKPDKCKNLYSDFVLNKIEDKVYESDFICAAAWLVSKKCLEVVGGFNPTFFHYGEDDNYVHRLKFKNLKIGVYPKVFIYHDREGRDNSQYFNPSISNERKLLLEFSNPNHSLNHKKELNIIRNKIIKNTLLFNFKEVDRLKKQKDLISKTFQQSIHNLTLSKEDKSYIFLDFNIL
ncbi:glycosyltransferase family 2 protein [Faecalibacter sp. LW9]|uniref:glycosyltransferase family 2 protein n=1 Tax=Faecalibacter sp. LW9 TaxID=3103144 RepID=UPI002AFF66C1|nr:glycosyltransferase family 2 protein [Faecalibacter sp. LW9]